MQKMFNFCYFAIGKFHLILYELIFIAIHNSFDGNTNGDLLRALVNIYYHEFDVFGPGC